MSVSILTGDCRSVLATLPAGEFHTCVTSPPYFGLRDYGHDGQLGLEPTPDEFVAALVAVFREVRRVLRDDGTLWLNMGDSYASGGRASRDFDSKLPARSNGHRPANPAGIKPKDLIGIPWMVAFALRADGWYLRQDIVWSKPNPMPESVRDRCTKAHEYIFLLSKSPRYYFDAKAIAEAAIEPGGRISTNYGNAGTGKPRTTPYDGNASETRNRRSVWSVASQPFSGAHFATFPTALIEPCILAGCPAKCCAQCGAPHERIEERTPMVLDRSERTHDKGRTRSSGTMLEPPTSRTLGFAPSCSCDAGTVPGRALDPFGGSGTTVLVARNLNRSATLIELNPAYAAMAKERVHGPLFVGAAE